MAITHGFEEPVLFDISLFDDSGALRANQISRSGKSESNFVRFYCIPAADFSEKSPLKLSVALKSAATVQLPVTSSKRTKEAIINMMPENAVAFEFLREEFKSSALGKLKAKLGLERQTQKELVPDSALYLFGMENPDKVVEFSHGLKAQIDKNLSAELIPPYCPL